MAKTRAARRSGSRVVRILRSHARLWISLGIGSLVVPFLPWQPITRVLVGWDVALALYLTAAVVMMARATVPHIRSHAATQDEGAFTILVLSVLAAAASLGALFVEVAKARRGGGYGLGPLALGIATILLSWTFVHTIFTLHYAHRFYGESEHADGLDFPGGELPDYWDFAYFAFVIGMTFQVSDVTVSNRFIRRVVVAHGALSFFFNTAIIALTVNMGSNAM